MGGSVKVEPYQDVPLDPLLFGEQRCDLLSIAESPADVSNLSGVSTTAGSSGSGSLHGATVCGRQEASGVHPRVSYVDMDLGA